MNKGRLIVAVLALALIPAVAQAQHAGFITGIAPPFAGVKTAPGFPQPVFQPFAGFGHVPYGFAGPYAPVVVTHPTTLVYPGYVTPYYGPFFHQQLHVCGTPHLHVIPHNYHQVIVPGGFYPAAQVVRPGAVGPVVAGTPAASGNHIAVGMSRAQVLSTLGSPNVSSYSLGRETLYFNYGVTVVLQNDRVAHVR